MKRHSLIALSAASLIATCQPLIASSLTIMTYNIRRMGDDKTEYQWTNRKERVINIILEKEPAVIGFQEVVIGQQLEDLKKGLSSYCVVGDIGRKTFATGWFQRRVVSLEKAKNESNPIFYDPEQVCLISHETFGINPVGKLFNASLPRVCTRATFKDRESKKLFTVYNTHLSSSGSWGLKDGTELIRNRQIRLILKNITKKQPHLPIFVMGDFNTTLKGAIQKRLTKAGFTHAKDITLTKTGPEATRTGWNDEQLKIIDHIIAKGNPSVLHYEVVESPKGEYPSDHRPVFITIEL